MSAVDVIEEPEILPCSFEFHSFHDQLNEVRIHCQFMKMEQSLYLWIGNYNEQSMKDLALAFAMEKNAKQSVVSTKILGPIADECSINIANRLSKKIGKPIYVSFNLDVDNLTLPIVERRIYEELKKHPEFLNL